MKQGKEQQFVITSQEGVRFWLICLYCLLINSLQIAVLSEVTNSLCLQRKLRDIIPNKSKNFITGNVLLLQSRVLL